jgi:hypothetical protein
MSWNASCLGQNITTFRAKKENHVSWVQRTIRIPYHHALPGLLTPRFAGWLQTAHPLHLPPDQFARPPKELLQQKEQLALIPACPLPPGTPSVSWVDGYIRYIPSMYPHYFHQVTDSFALYLKEHASKSRRKKYRKIQRLFQEEFGSPIRWEWYDRNEEFDDFIQVASAISRRTYQSLRLGLGLPDTPDELTAFREWLLEDGWIGALLYAKEQPIAFLIGRFVGDDILCLEHGGYDPDYRDWSPGTLLDYLFMERLYEQPHPTLQTVDLSEGEGFHKSAFATCEHQAGDVYFFRPGVRSVGFLASHWSALRGSHAFREWLKEHQLEQKMRQFVRGEQVS